MASRHGSAQGLRYHRVRPPAPRPSALPCFKRPTATRLRRRAVALALAHSVRQVRCPMTVTSLGTVSRPPQEKCAVRAACKFRRSCLGRTRAHCYVRRSKPRKLRSQRVPGRTHQNADDRFRRTLTRMYFFPFFLFLCMLYLLTTPLKRDSDRLHVVISYAISGVAEHISFLLALISKHLYLPWYIVFTHFLLPSYGFIPWRRCRIPAGHGSLELF